MKTMSLQKSSYILSKCFKIISIIVGFILTVVLLATFVGSLAYYNAPKQMLLEMIYSDMPNFTISDFVTKMLLMSVQLLCVYVILRHLTKMFNWIGKGESPFLKQTAVQIKKMMKWIFIYYGVNLFVPQNISSIGMGLLLLMSLYCVALIFEYGSSLQQEVDETL